MLVIITISTILGFILIFLLKRSSAPIAMESAYYQQDRLQTSALQEMAPEEFRELCVDLAEALGLRVTSVETPESGTVDITAVMDHPVLGGVYLINGILSPTDQIVDSAPVIGLSSAVHQERAMKGIFMTTGYFSQEVDKILEGAPVELINRDRLADLLEEHGIAKLEKGLREEHPSREGEDEG